MIVYRSICPNVRVPQSPSTHRVPNLTPGHNDPDNDCGDHHRDDNSNERVEDQRVTPKQVQMAADH